MAPTPTPSGRPMPSHDELPKRTVPQLKALCKQLGIQGCSKLNKAQLVQKIQLATPNATPATAVDQPGRDLGGSAVSANSASAAVAPSDAPAPPLKAPTRSLKRKPESQQITHKAPPPPQAYLNQQPSTASAVGAGSPLPTPETTLKVTSPAPPVHFGARRPAKIAPPKKVAATSLSSSGIRQPISSVAKPVKALRFAHTASRFTPLLVTKPNPSKHPSGPLSTKQAHALVPIAAESRAARLAHVRSHFVERVFRQLYSTDLPCASGLHFNGLHSQVYDCDNAAFAAALRFWVARLHTALQLGAALGAAAGWLADGRLGPDLKTWPQVTACRRVVDGVYLVTTSAAARVDAPDPGSHGADVGSIKFAKGTEHGSVQSPDHAQDRAQDGATAYLAIAATREVIGSSLGRSAYWVEGCAVRADWHAFIMARGASEGRSQVSDGCQDGRLCPSTPRSLLDHVKTKEASAINAAWQGRIVARATAAINVAPAVLSELAVAERAVLASCALNSFSGSKLDAVRMDAEWLSNPGVERPGKSEVELYLPESHQVLSVHLPPPPFHPALAVVHRASGRSEFVLAETGQGVGDEDEGVCALWQGLLGCDAKGVEVDSGGEFWEGWQQRM